jgi:hypothetical protein
MITPQNETANGADQTSFHLPDEYKWQTPAQVLMPDGSLELRDKYNNRLVAVKHANGRCYEVDSRKKRKLGRISQENFDDLAKTEF